MSDDNRGGGNRDERHARATAKLSSWIEQNSFSGLRIRENDDTGIDGGDDGVSSVSVSEVGFIASVVEDEHFDASGYLYQQQQRDQQAKSSPTSTASHALSAPTASASGAGEDTYLPHFSLGDVGSLRDMLHDPSNSANNDEAHLRAEIDSLKVHDFAFILRSDGRWTYAIIAEREKDTIRFVVDTDGGTKSFLKRNWPSSIQLVNPEACRRSWRKKGGRNKELKNKKEEKDQRICTATKNKCKKQRSI